MTSLRQLSSALLASALLALAGCGGGGDGESPPAPVQVDSARTASATLGPAGGTVAATAADGRRYTLTVEPGALASDTVITATPVLTMGDAPLAGGLRAAVRFGPSGLRFALPATLRIEGANTASATGSKLVGFVRSQDGASMQLLAPVLADGAIEMQVPHFSDVGVSLATAQAVAQVPTDPNARPDEALVDEFMRGFPDTPNQAAEVALLVRLHDTRVEPRLVVAEFRSLSTDSEREMAILVARQWLVAIDMSFPTDTDGLNPDALPGNLGPLVRGIRQRVLAILTEDFEVGRTACMGPAPVGSAQLAGLQQALRARAQVGLFRQLGGLPGLGFDTVARRLNDCVRIVFEPRPLPTFTVGRPVSLDLRAQLIFAADPNASIQVPFEFDVFSSTARFGTEFFSSGFSDAQGRYTTVVTPTEANPQFDVDACMVVNLRSGGPVGSALCGRQAVVATPSSVVLAGRVTVNTASVRGAVDFRVRAFPDGTLTVIEASGQVTKTSTFTQQCRPDPTAFLTEVTLQSQTVDTITQGKFFLSAGRPPEITAFGPGIRTTESLVDPANSCAVVSTSRNIVDSDEFSSVAASAIEKGSDGLPTVIEFNRNGYSGRLLRE